MPFTYRQTSGYIFTPDDSYMAAGYSGGNCGQNPEGVNNPALQTEKDIGPIPQGTYTIGAAFTDPKRGPVALPLTPDPANDMFGRDAFMIHGDLISGPPFSASEGCIILSRAVREQIAASDDKQLEVIP
jgi:hypothetical protein